MVQKLFFEVAKINDEMYYEKRASFRECFFDPRIIVQSEDDLNFIKIIQELKLLEKQSVLENMFQYNIRYNCELIISKEGWSTKCFKFRTVILREIDLNILDKYPIHSLEKEFILNNKDNPIFCKRKKNKLYPISRYKTWFSRFLNYSGYENKDFDMYKFEFFHQIPLHTESKFSTFPIVVYDKFLTL